MSKQPSNCKGMKKSSRSVKKQENIEPLSSLKQSNSFTISWEKLFKPKKHKQENKSVEIAEKPFVVKKGEEADFEVMTILNGNLEDLDLVFTIDGNERVVDEELFYAPFYENYTW